MGCNDILSDGTVFCIFIFFVLVFSQKINPLQSSINQISFLFCELWNFMKLLT